MYCIEVRQRNYPVHFTLLLSHAKGAPPRAAIQELFETFGKCNVRTKDNTMTYINFLRYDHVTNVLEARNQAKLVLNDMVVLVDELVPVQRQADAFARNVAQRAPCCHHPEPVHHETQPVYVVQRGQKKRIM